MPDFPSDVPVVVIGAGPTGLTTASLLARYGVSVLLLERNAEPMDIPRAIVLDDEGARSLQVLGLHDSYVARTIEGTGAKYFDDAGHCFAETGAGGRDYGFCKRHFINQPELERALRDHIEAEPQIDLRFSAEVVSMEEAGDHIRVMVRDADGTEHLVRAQYVAACDGGRSPTRESLGIGLEGSTYKQDWLVIDTLNDPDDSSFSKFSCSSERPSVSVPAPHGGRRYEFMLRPGETHTQVLEAEFVRDLVAPFRELLDADIIRKTIYTFHARVAEHWRAGRILLLGDAAHLTPPFAGQGMNAGLRDATNAAWKLACAVHGTAAPASLDSYFDERRDPAWAMIQIAVAMGDAVMPQEAGDIAFREALMRKMAPFPGVRDYLLQMKFKPKPRYARGLFLDLGAQRYEGSLVGEMIPQPRVSVEGTSRLLDDVIGPGFALIAQDAGGAAALDALTEDAFCGLPLGRVVLGWPDAAVGLGDLPPARSAAPARRARIEADQGFARPLRTHRDQILLVRPDRYAAAAFEADQLMEGLDAFKRRLLS